MSNKREKIPESVTQGSVKSTIVSFVIAVLYGVVAAVGFASGREMLEYVITIFTSGLVVNAANLGGYANLSTIISVSVMALAWLSTFMLVWYLAEHAEDMGKRVLVGAKWILGAIAFIFITSVVVYVLTGAWPRLNGA